MHRIDGDALEFKSYRLRPPCHLRRTLGSFPEVKELGPRIFEIPAHLMASNPQDNTRPTHRLNCPDAHRTRRPVPH